jgi:CHAT domain-containing protein/tetratricopeptide (TPR) repeat protein
VGKEHTLTRMPDNARSRWLGVVCAAAVLVFLRVSEQSASLFGAEATLSSVDGQTPASANAQAPKSGPPAAEDKSESTSASGSPNGSPSIDSNRTLQDFVRQRYLQQANRFQGEGKLSEAIVAAERVLEIERDMFGEVHAEVAETLGWLAQLHEGREDFTAAQSLRQEALDLAVQLYGPRHWKVTNARHQKEWTEILLRLDPGQLARLKESCIKDAQAAGLLRQGRFSSAIRLYEEVVRVRGELIGEKHPSYAIPLNDLAVAYTENHDLSSAEKLFPRCLNVHEQVFGVAHPAYATALSNFARLYKSKGELNQAKLLCSKAADIDKLALGDMHPSYATSLNNLACLYADGSEYTRAQRLHEEALRIRRNALGEQHPDTAQSLNNLASVCQSLGDYVRAESLFSKTLVIRRETQGRTHPDYAGSLNNLGCLYQYMGDDSRAEPLHREALQLRRENLGETHPDTAQSLHNLGSAYRSMGLYSQAEALLREAVTIKEGIFGNQHIAYAESLSGLASLLEDMGEYRSAEPLYQQALKIQRKSFGENHPDYATSLSNVGLFYKQIGDYTRAESLYHEALKIQARTIGERHPSYAIGLANLAALYATKDDFVRAKPLLLEATQITKDVFGESHPDYAKRLSGLAGFYEHVGDFAKAEPLRQTALHIVKEKLGTQHPHYANQLNNLAAVYTAMGDYIRAEQLHREVLEIVEKTLGKKSPEYALSLGNLAQACAALMNYSSAESLHREALEITREVLGERHLQYANGLNNLAEVYAATGQYDRALELHQDALEIKTKLLGEKHASRAESLSNLGGVYARTGDYAKARVFLNQALDVDTFRVRTTLALLSERQQIVAVSSLKGSLDGLLSLGPADDGNSERVYEYVLNWKGATFLRQYGLHRQRDDPQVAQRVEQLKGVSQRIATLVYSEPKAEYREEWEKQLAQLSEKREALEIELAEVDYAGRTRQGEVNRGAEALRASLPDQTTLVDFFQYVKFTPSRESRSGWERELHLAVFLIERGRPVMHLALGPVRLIEEAIERWRTEIQGGEPHVRSGARPAGAAPAGGSQRGVDLSNPRRLSSNVSVPETRPDQSLRRLIWEPLERHLVGAQLVIVSPDGALNRCPFVALPGRSPGQYLLEEIPIAVVAVPQMLPELLGATETQSTQQGACSETDSMLLVGDVDFGAQPSEFLAQGTSADAGPDAARGNSRLTFGRLPGAAAEIKTTGAMFKQANREAPLDALTGSEATEAAFRALAPAHRHLHLATHGFFAPPEVRSALAAPAVEPRMLVASSNSPFRFEQTIAGFHPGVLSGLALAGANLGAQPTGTPGQLTDDGILTASEVAGLDLRSTDLVVLSACETGLGAVAGGEGVLGLQRAFQMAGARTVVASLWKVDDEATRVLMERFYENLWQKKMGKLMALREAQLWMLREGYQVPELGGARSLTVDKSSPLPSGTPRLPPAYWAAFVLSGDWR